MSLMPLGYNKSLLSPTFEEQNSLSLKHLSPLGHNLSPLSTLSPLGQSPEFSLLQPSLIQPQTNDWGLINDESEEDRDADTQPSTDERANFISPSPTLPILSSLTSKSPSETVRLSQDDTSSTNPDNSENLNNLKPLGIPKPLIQKSHLRISSSLTEPLGNYPTDLPPTSLSELSKSVQATWQNSEVQPTSFPIIQKIPSQPIENTTENIISASNIQQPATSTSSSIQTRLENTELPLHKPLGLTKPLSQIIDDFAGKLSTDSSRSKSPVDNSSPDISTLPDDRFPNIFPSLKSTEINSLPGRELADNLSNVSASVGENTTNGNDAIANLPPLNPIGFSQPLNNSKFLLPSLDLASANTEQKSKAIGFDEPPNPTQPTAEPPSQNIPDSWSSISELLGQNTIGSPDSILPKDDFAPLSLLAPPDSYSLSSPNISQPSSAEIPATADSKGTSQQLTLNSSSKSSSIKEEQLEMLAQKVYTLIRQRLEIDLERQGKSYVGYPILLSNITSLNGTSAKVKSSPQRETTGQHSPDETREIFPTDPKLIILSQQIYYLIRQRLEISRERQGNYYLCRLNR